MNSLHDSIQKQYSFSRYVELMKGNACDIITTVSDCSHTIANYGLDTATMIYIQELETSANIANNTYFDNSQIILIENYSKVIENSFVYGIQVYTNYTDGLINQQESYMILTTVGFFLIVLLWYIYFLHTLVDRMKDELQKKSQVLELFKDSSSDLIHQVSTILTK